MPSFESIVQDIRQLRVQGAKNVAKASAKAISAIVNNNRRNSDTEIIASLERAKQILIKTRPTEPAMRNVLNYLLTDLKEINELTKRQVFVKLYRLVIGDRHLQCNANLFIFQLDYNLYITLKHRDG